MERNSRFVYSFSYKLYFIKRWNQYVFGDDDVSPIELNNTRFNYDYERDTKINQSLIKLFGLGEGKRLFPLSGCRSY